MSVKVSQAQQLRNALRFIHITLAAAAGFCLLVFGVHAGQHMPDTFGPLAFQNQLKWSPPALSDGKTEAEPASFTFGVGYPKTTYFLQSGREAIVTVYWDKDTWAHIEHFTSKVYAGEATILELEGPQPGLYPVTLDSGQTLGTVVAN